VTARRRWGVKAMELDEAKMLCERWLPLWTGNRPDQLIRAYADDVFYRDPALPRGVQGRPAFLAYLRQLLARFPDWAYRPDAIWPVDGGFVLRWHATIPVGDTIVRETGMDLVLVDGGLIARNEVYFDGSAVLEAARRGGKLARREAAPSPTRKGGGSQ